jgi:hypothetical protein
LSERCCARRTFWGERALIRTFGPRGTIHLLPTADLAGTELTIDELTEEPARRSKGNHVRPEHPFMCGQFKASGRVRSRA